MARYEDVFYAMMEASGYTDIDFIDLDMFGHALMEGVNSEGQTVRVKISINMEVA